jgi:hypothetical protein
MFFSELKILSKVIKKYKICSSFYLEFSTQIIESIVLHNINNSLTSWKVMKKERSSIFIKIRKKIFNI